MSSVYRGPSSRQEWDSSWRMRDARPWFIRTAEKLSRPKRLAMVFAGMAFVMLPLPAFALPVVPLVLMMYLFYLTRRYRLPLRLPKEERALRDPGDLAPAEDRNGKVIQPTRLVPGKPGGIFFLGNVRDFNREGAEPEELWISNSDSRTHFLVLGTTGSGKSEMLLSMAFNALSWGSGLIYIDGKADTSLKAKMYSLCRMVGREVDFYVLNFMTGDTDVWERKRTEERMSNTMNVFVGGSSNSATQLVSSLMPESGGDNAMWQGLAIGMINAVIIGLYFKRYKDNLPIDAGILRDHIEMTKIISLAREFKRDPSVPHDLVFKPIETYLLNLPGFDWKTHVDGGEPVGEDTKKQHDFRSMQFLRQLTMLADTYGAVFKHQIPEVEMLDVVLSRRILVVMIPSLEKSEEESQGVGKLVVSSLKLMMALTLGSKVEGSYADIIDSKPTNAPSPFPVILDELGYYFTKGLAVMFAQARSLGFAMVAAGQDIPAMSKGANKEEAESVIANTKYKIGLAMEDPDRTGDLLIKTADKALVAETSGYTGQSGMFDVGYRDMMNVSLQERNRLTLSELRALDSGEGVLMWKDKIIRYSTFYAFGSAKLAAGGRLNHLLKLRAPRIEQIDTSLLEPISTQTRSVDSEMEGLMIRLGHDREGNPIQYMQKEDDPLAKAITGLLGDLDWEFADRPIPVGAAEYEVALVTRMSDWVAGRIAVGGAESSEQAGEADGAEDYADVSEVSSAAGSGETGEAIAASAFFDDEFVDAEKFFALHEAVKEGNAAEAEAESARERDPAEAAEATAGSWAEVAAEEAITERTVVVAPEVSEALFMLDGIASGDLRLPEDVPPPLDSEAEQKLLEAVKPAAVDEETQREEANAFREMFSDWDEFLKDDVKA